MGCSSANYNSPLIISTTTKVRSKRTSREQDVAVNRPKMNKFQIGFTDSGGLTIRQDDPEAVLDACHIPEAPKV